MYSLLEQINNPEDLRKLSRSNLPELATELREFILDTLSTKPGHLGASLGVIELSIALHYFYDTPNDLLIWDVGHQSYPHKILTGRKNKFSSLRQLGGISGFPDRSESEYDAFGTGHSSTSISAITGMAMANAYLNNNKQHIAVIGDASLPSGMALEALNHLGSTDLNVLIILNDNSIGIDASTGALKKHFRDLSSSSSSNLFEDFGCYYFGPIDGHDFNALFTAFEELKDIHRPKVLHIKTTKGKGYTRAEEDQVKWHSPGVFDKETGIIHQPIQTKTTYQQIFGETIIDLMNNNSSIFVITPAMLTGSHLVEAKNKFPNRIIDVGIAEQHAVTFSSGLATQNIIPYCVIYSTFLQRAYDQIIHDVALQNIPVVFCIDRAEAVGSDGATHHGYFDISFLNTIPNIIVSSPKDARQFKDLLYTAQFTKQAFAIRYPKDITTIDNHNSYKKLEVGKGYPMLKGKDVAVISTGSLGDLIYEILQEIDVHNLIGWFDFPFIKPLDTDLLKDILNNYSTIITLEKGALNGGFGASVLTFANQNNYSGKIKNLGYPDCFIPHGTLEELNAICKLDKQSLTEFLRNYI